MNKDFLEKTGMSFYQSEDFYQKDITLRKGGKAILWVHKSTGHGILEENKWATEDYYSEEYRKEYSGNASGKKIESENHFKMYKELNKRQFSQFKELLTEGSKFLEVGGSFGGIIDNVLKTHIDECHVVEPNIDDAIFLKNKYDKLKVFNTMLEDANLNREYYDTAVSFEVLEHVPNPRIFLEKINKSLKPGGKIHLEVPNHNDVLLSCYSKKTTYEDFFYHKAHIHYFTEASLSELLSMCGFRGSVSSFLMYPFFNHVYWHFNKSPQLTGTDALTLPEPTSCRTSAEIDINNFYKKVEEEYEKLINKHLVGDCLVYQGEKK